MLDERDLDPLADPKGGAARRPSLEDVVFEDLRPEDIVFIDGEPQPVRGEASPRPLRVLGPAPRPSARAVDSRHHQPIGLCKSMAQTSLGPPTSGRPCR
jgi:hypothetical protein